MIYMMKTVQKKDFNNLFRPEADSHKGQNGRLHVIGGSHLFHAASLWSLTVASRIVDLVHYSSVPENNEIVAKAKEEFRNGIVVPRVDIENYIEEDDCILIGPGMMRSETSKVHGSRLMVHSLEEINSIDDEGGQTEALTNYLLTKYPNKQWVIDAGALQMVDPRVIPKNAILTPHYKEYINFADRALVAIRNFGPFPVSLVEMAQPALLSETHSQSGTGQNFNSSPHDLEKHVQYLANKLGCTVLLKGQIDIACSPTECREIQGGNAGMTKGGTGDVLAGLIAALACKNDPYLATIAGSYINKKAGDELYKTMGPYFNATDLANEIPKVMKELIYEK